MGWWSIVKSSRREAYSVFLEEFGPEVDLRSLEVENFLDDPENAGVEYYLSVSNVSDEIMGHWVIQSNGSNIRFVSDKYPQYQVFVEGMFKEEYPKRYQEIVDMFKQVSPQENDDAMVSVVSRYIDRAEEIMEHLTKEIKTSYDPPYDELISSLTRGSLVAGISPLFIREKLNKEIKSSGNFSKGVIIMPIATTLVDRIIRHREIATEYFKSSENMMSKRDTFIALYYNLFMRGITFHIPTRPISSSTSMDAEIVALVKFIRRMVIIYEDRRL